MLKGVKLYYIYLQKKYESPCNLSTNEIIINVDSTELDLGYSSIDKLFNKESLEEIIKCLTTNMMDTENEQNLIFNIRLTLPVSDIPDYYNLLIFNTKNRKVYHIDPNGKYSPYYRLSFRNLFTSNNNKSLNDLVEQAIETIVNIINKTLNIEKEDTKFTLDMNFNKMDIFQNIGTGLSTAIDKVINTFNFYESPVIEDGNFNEIWLMMLTEFILKYKNLSPEEIYNTILNYIRVNSERSKGKFLRNLMLGYINYCFNRVLKMYNIIYDTNFTSANINTKISKNVYRIIGVIESFSYVTVIENFKNNALLIVEYEKYKKNNPYKNTNDFIKNITGRIDDFFPSISSKIEEMKMLIKQIEDEQNKLVGFSSEVTELLIKINTLKNKIQSTDENSYLYQRLEQDLTHKQSELRVLQYKISSTTININRLKHTLESITYYIHQRNAFIESINKFKSYNIKKANRNISLSNKTMRINPEPIKSVSSSSSEK